MQLKNWLCNQVNHCIGIKQTAKTQVTDIRFAKLGKDAANGKKTERRRLRRIKAKKQSVAAQLVSKKLDLMHICLTMMHACIADNAQNKGVVKAFRMGGWLAYRPTSTSLMPAQGAAWREHPLGSSRLALSLMEQRYTWLDGAGNPQKPCWNELKDLRKRQASAYVQQKGKGLSDETKRAHLLAAGDDVHGFVDFLGGFGQKPFEDEDEAPASERPSPLTLPWVAPEDLHQDANFLALHPRVRRALIENMELSQIPSQRKTRKAAMADGHILKKMRKTTRRAEMRAEWRRLVDGVGIEEARKRAIPAIVTKLQRKNKKEGEKKKAAGKKIWGMG